MDRKLLNIINSEVEGNKWGVLCIVTEETGSTPRSRGASMWVRPDGSISGTVGGGLMEHEVIEAASELLKSGEQNRVLRRELSAEHGMLCGGNTSVYMEVIGRTDELLIFGAGHVGKAVARLGAFTGFNVTVWDEREEFANGKNIPCARTVACPLGEIFENGIKIHDRSYVVIMTRGHALDADVVKLTDNLPGAYYGMIGSRSKIAALRKALLEAGVSSEHLNRIHQPIGLPINAETPEEIAVSVIAEIISVKRR